MIIKKITACLGLVALTCNACNLPSQAASTKIPPSPNATENRTVLEATAVPLPTAQSTTPAFEPSPTLVGSGGGDSSEANSPLAEADFEKFPQVLLDYLNSGGAVKSLSRETQDLGYAQKDNPFLSGDLDGDETDDLVVSIVDPSVQAVLRDGAKQQDGTLLIYLYEDGGYDLSLTLPYGGGPHLWMVEDLDSDGRSDLVVSRGTCGAHTCFEEVSILSWDGTSFVNRLEGTSADLPTPRIEAQDPNGDGVYQLEITGTDYGSAGAGPTRTRTWIWTYDPVSWHWVKTEEALGEPKYRIHMLQDAEDSAKNGGFEQALLLYERVIADSTLQEWTDPSLEGANLGAYARFKMFLIYLILGQGDLAQIVYTEMVDSFPAGTAQYGFVEMADAFQQGFSNLDLAAACKEVENYAAAHTNEVLAPLNSFGYANPIFTLQDLCL